MNKKSYSPNFKGAVVLESFITGNVAATADRNNLHLSVLNRWRKEFQTNMHKIWSDNNSKDNNKQMEHLENIIGRLTVEKELLKKVSGLIR